MLSTQSRNTMYELFNEMRGQDYILSVTAAPINYMHVYSSITLNSMQVYR